MGESSANRWIEALSDEDVAFVRRFVLASGSLKELAKQYGISYPTVRLRLDRLIVKIQIFEDHSVTSAFERKMRSLYADGRLDLETLKTVIAAHHEESNDSLQTAEPEAPCP